MPNGEAHGSETVPDAAWESLKTRLLRGESLLVDGVPGAGRTTLAQQLAVHAIVEADDDAWAPVLVLTPDRHRAAELDLEIARALPAGTAGMFQAPGSHRLVRSLSSYAHLIAGLWRVEREDPLPRLPFTSGAREDAWLAGYLERNAELWRSHYGEDVISSPAFRMEVRNVIARSGEVGLEAADLKWLGAELDRPLWELTAHAYAEYAGSGRVPFTLDTPHVDSARIPRIAAHLVEGWERDAANVGVIAPLPVPKILIVDDVQDMPASATPLISEVANRAGQTILLSSPKSATAEFRGGRPDLGSEIANLLGLEVARLETSLRSVGPVAEVGYEVTDWIAPEPGTRLTQARLQGAAVSADLVATETKRDALIAQQLRQHHLEGRVAWENMAVVMRGAAGIEPLRRRLARLEIPLHPANRPVQLAKSPTCAALLRLLKLGGEVSGLGSDPDGGDAIETDSEYLQQSAVDLVGSPLVNADPLAVFRLIRDLRALDADGAYAGAGTLGLLEIPDRILQGLEDTDDASRAKVLNAIRTARDLWRIKERAALDPAEVGLWKLWEAAGIADSLRDRATSTDPAKAVSKEFAADTLDSVIALFRKADLWQQEQLEVSPDDEQIATAFRFATETLEQTVATDPLVKSGFAEPGVSIVTASQAAGAQWDVVCVVGPQLGEWPSTGFDSLAQLGRLRLIVDDATERGWPGEVPISAYLPDLNVARATNYRQARVERARNDARLFLSAVTRARNHLHFFAVESEDQAPSRFLLTLVEAGLLNPLHGDAGEPLYTELSDDLNLISLVAALRRQLVSATSDDAQRSQAARLLGLLSVVGVTAADPQAWLGAGSVSTDKPILDAGRISLSPSQLETADDCQLQWFFNSIQGGDQETGEEPEVFTKAALGTLIHGIAEDFPAGTHAELLQAFEERWPTLGLADETHWGRQWKQAGARMVTNLADYFASFEGSVETELWMRFEVGDGVVNGRIDRLETLPDGTVRVVDIKTGARKTQRQVAEDVQLRAYQLGVKELGFETGGASLLQVAAEGTQARVVTQAPLDETALAEQRQNLVMEASRLSGATFLAQPDFWRCNFCPFKKACPAVQGKKGDGDV